MVYGNPVSLTITITVQEGMAAPTGNVEVFEDGNIVDLGPAAFLTSVKTRSTFTFSTSPKTFNVSSQPYALPLVSPLSLPSPTARGRCRAVKQSYPCMSIMAASNTKTYDSTTNAMATPVVTGFDIW